MKVCLVYPATIVEMGHWLPLGLAYIAANLRENGHTVRVIDRESLRRKLGNIDKANTATKEILDKEKPELIGISATTPLINDSYLVAGIAKKSVPGSLIAIGGNHVTSLPEETLNECKDIDVVVIGEGEFTFLDLANKRRLEEIKGIAYRHDGNISFNENRECLENLDLLPHPARALFDTDYYMQTNPDVIRGVELKGTHVFTARGCPYSCAFCAGSRVFGKKVRYHSIGYVIKELDDVITKYGVEGVYFVEDMFAFDKERAISLCNRMIDEGLHKKIRWVAELRADVASLDLLKLMKKAGCIQVEYGFESGSQRMLNLMKKGTTVEKNIRAATLTKEAGLRLLASVIVGYPGDTKEDFNKTADFLKEIKPDFIGWNKYAPLPGSEIFEKLKRERKIHGNWEEINIGIKNTRKFNFTDMDIEEFMNMFEHVQHTLVEPTNDAAYLKYNLKNNFFMVAKTFARKYYQDPIGTTKRALKTAARLFSNTP